MQEQQGEQGLDEPLLELNNVSIEFGRDSSWLSRLGFSADLFGESSVVRAVDGVSLDMYENDVVVLVGESGCGKTTLGKAAIGIHRPLVGEIKYRGQDIWDAFDKRGDVNIPFKEIRKSLQIIHQDPGSSLNPNKRVISSLAKPLLKWQTDMPREARETRIYELLERVGMSPPEDYAQRYPHQLSGGEKQRVALVRALLMNPDIILADEAVSALDVSLRIEMMDLLLELQDVYNTSYLFISHDLSNARYIAEKAGGRIGVMYLGRLVEIGPVDQIINDPKHPYTQVLRWATPHLEEKGTSDPPLRKIDIPDPVDPPAGCRFHTRCPEAREMCANQYPPTYDVSPKHEVSCYRVDSEHEYWESPELED